MKASQDDEIFICCHCQENKLENPFEIIIEAPNAYIIYKMCQECLQNTYGYYIKICFDCLGISFHNPEITILQEFGDEAIAFEKTGECSFQEISCENCHQKMQ